MSHPPWLRAGYATYMNGRLKLFPYDSNVDDDKCLFDTLRGTGSDVKRFLKTFRKNNVDKIIFAHLNINSLRNIFD